MKHEQKFGSHLSCIVSDSEEVHSDSRLHIERVFLQERASRVRSHLHQRSDPKSAVIVSDISHILDLSHKANEAVTNTFTYINYYSLLFALVQC